VKSQRSPIVDWTFAAAPEPDEPAWLVGGADSDRPGGHTRRWLEIQVACAVVVAAAWILVAALPCLQSWQTRQAVEDVIARQEQARLARDWGAFRETLEEPTSDWANQQVQRMSSGWQAAAFGLPGARLAGTAGQVNQFQALTPASAVAEVIRTYILADGTQAEFAMPQYYTFEDGGWHQVPAPRGAAGDLEALHGARVDVHYNPSDAAVAASVAEDLEAVLARACADWNCPAGLRVAVIFGRPDPIPSDGIQVAGQPPNCRPWPMLAGGPYPVPGLIVTLPTREWGGYPADQETMRAVQRVVAFQALANVAARMSGEAPGILVPIRPASYVRSACELARLSSEAPAP